MIAPLDTAIAVYRAQAYAAGNTIIPNEGTRTEPLVLGPTIASEPQDAIFASGVLQFRDVPSPNQANRTWSHADIPVAQLNGSLTVAMRMRPMVRAFEAKSLILIVDNVFTAPKKVLFLDVTSDNRFMVRMWANNPNNSQIVAQTPTGVAKTNIIRTVVARWDDAAKQLSIALNGVVLATASPPAGFGRIVAAASPLYVTTPWVSTTSLASNYDLFATAAWDRALSDQEIADLQTNTDWGV